MIYAHELMLNLKPINLVKYEELGYGNVINFIINIILTKTETSSIKSKKVETAKCK